MCFPALLSCKGIGSADGHCPPEPGFAPADALREVLRQWCLAWLHTEPVRLGVAFSFAKACAAWPGHLGRSPHSLRETAENLLRNGASCRGLMQKAAESEVRHVHSIS